MSNLKSLRGKIKEAMEPKVSLLSFLGLLSAYGIRRYENDNGQFVIDELPIESARFVVLTAEWIPETLRGEVVEAILRVAKIVDLET